MKTSKYLSICAILAAGAFVGSCAEDRETFDNTIWVDDASTVSTLLLDGDAETATYGLTFGVPQPTAQELNVTFGVDPSLLDVFNEVYGMKAILLPEEFYTLDQPVATITQGGIKSSAANLELHNLGDIDPDYVYVVPVTVKSSTIPVLASKRNRFFVVRGASLINWTIDMLDTYFRLASSSNATGLNGLSKVTVEALVWPAKNLGEGNDANISTWLGIEGNGLLRFGDSEPAFTLQFASSSNVSNSQWTIEAEKWQFLTFTYDSTTGVCQFYIDGVQKGGDVSSVLRSKLNWGASNFYIGYSYSSNRDWHGKMCEVRVWNRILTKEEIQAKNHFYKVDPDSEGLVSYWKMNEGGGNRIHDYANGYDLNANGDVTWAPVQLPQ